MARSTVLATVSESLVFSEPEAIPRVFTDDKKLSQILRNLISNALKFTVEGQGSVSAAMATADTGEFAVTDTGIGVAPEHLSMLFNDFMQLDTRLQRRLRGTGLGLSPRQVVRPSARRRGRGRQRTWQGIAFRGQNPSPLHSCGRTRRGGT